MPLTAGNSLSGDEVHGSGLKNEELLVHSERFIDPWIEETFIWILVAFAYG